MILIKRREGREKSVAKSKVCEAWIVHSVDPKLSTGSSLFEMHSVENVARLRFVDFVAALIFSRQPRVSFDKTVGIMYSSKSCQSTVYSAL